MRTYSSHKCLSPTCPAYSTCPSPTPLPGELSKALSHLETFYQLARRHKWHTESGDGLHEIACEHLRRVYTALAESEGEGGRVEYLCKALDMAKESEFECVCVCVCMCACVCGRSTCNYIHTYVHTYTLVSVLQKTCRQSLHISTLVWYMYMYMYDVHQHTSIILHCVSVGFLLCQPSPHPLGPATLPLV